MPYQDVHRLYGELDAKIRRWRRRHGRPPQCAFVPTGTYEELKIAGFTRISGVALVPAADDTIFLSPDGATRAAHARQRRFGGSRRTRRTRRREAAEGTLIYGAVNDKLIFVEESRAREIAAVWKAKTWGQLKRRAPNLYAEAIELLREAAEWDEDEHPYEVPKDGNAFDATSVPGVEDGDWPDFVAQKMLTLLPSAVLEEFGTITQTAINGEMLQLDPADAKRIVKALQQAGHTCRRDDQLIRRVLDMA